MGAVARLFYDAERRRLGPLVRGHVLLYEPRDGPAYSAAAGLRLLLGVAVLELLIGPRMEGLARLGVPLPPPIVVILILLAAALVWVRFVARVPLADVGFVPLARWRPAETLYLAQIFLVAGPLFAILFGARFTPGAAAGFLATQLIWGFYQELIYRGLLQTELARRFGAVPGALAANLAFTFGPLHLYHLQGGRPLAQTALVMGSIFAIGLVFAIIYGRSRNVWLVGLLHGVGDAFSAAAAMC